MSAKRDGLLQVATDGQEVTIRIGVSALAKAIKWCPDLPNVRVTDELLFAESMVSALHEEEEDGTTRVHRMFDAAAEWALEQGSEGFEEE